jgi:ferrochelatase
MIDPSDRIGVVLMAYGTPRTPDDIEAFYTDIRRGRPPTEEALADLTRRYAAIGGTSPLAEITEAQRTRLVGALDLLETGRYEVRLGFKHADPKVGATAAGFLADGFRRITGLVLAPHYSTASIGGYLAQLESVVGERAIDPQPTGSRVDDPEPTGVRTTDSEPIEVRVIESWATEEAYVGCLADDLGPRVSRMRAEVGSRLRPGPRVCVVFTAHSLPQRVIDGGDPYVDELRSTAKAVADRLSLVEGVDWQIAWQSAGRTPEPWIGPDVLDVIDEMGRRDDVGGVIVCACGFVADHLEVLYDLDIEAAERASANHLAFDRTASIADDAAVMSALARLVRDRSTV